MNQEKQPSYYAIIPATVRYDERLKFAERLLYGEITSLIGKEGYCFARNSYFAQLYGVIPGTISRWISHLEKLGYIKVEIIKNDKKEIVERRIYITDISIRKSVSNTYEQKKQYPISRKTKDNNINIKIDRLFNYSINKKSEILKKEFQNESEYNEFCIILERLEMNYTKDIISIFAEDNIEKIKIITYCVKELITSNKNSLALKLNRNRLINIYDKCKKIELENKNTDKEIKNFFDYYYASVIKDLEIN